MQGTDGEELWGKISKTFGDSLTIILFQVLTEFSIGILLLVNCFYVLYIEAKPQTMETKAAQQEILLVTDTQFAHRQWAEKENSGLANLSAIEQLEKVCWDGLVKDLIPELNITLRPDIKLWLWQIHQTKSFLALDFFEFPGPKERYASIDPYLFMNEIWEN